MAMSLATQTSSVTQHFPHRPPTQASLLAVRPPPNRGELPGHRPDEEAAARREPRPRWLINCFAIGRRKLVAGEYVASLLHAFLAWSAARGDLMRILSLAVLAAVQVMLHPPPARAKTALAVSDPER